MNGEERSLNAILPVAKEYGAAVIGLVMDDNGITQEPEKRLVIAEKILERAVKYFTAYYRFILINYRRNIFLTLSLA